MIIDGRKIAEEMLQDIAKQVSVLNLKLKLVDIVVGDNPVQRRFVKAKARSSDQAGIKFVVEWLESDCSTEDILRVLNKYAQDSSMSGILVQLPLPKFIDTPLVLSAIPKHLDVDCLNPESQKAFYESGTGIKFVPPTAGAIVKLLLSTGVALAGKSAVVVGQGMLVGKPVTKLLEDLGLEVSTADINTKDLSVQTKKADVVITAVGKPNLITGNMLKLGAIVIDAGTSENSTGLVGDVESESVLPVAGFLSPVPGGVGPVTVACLLKNCLTLTQAV